ncbi:hypothetical protein AWENTII_009027 [Aspergillus wentii]
MHDIEQIEGWHTNDRCMELRVIFADGRQDALGRWDDPPADYSQKTVMFIKGDHHSFDGIEIPIKDLEMKHTELLPRSYASGIRIGDTSVGEMTDEGSRYCQDDYLYWEYNRDLDSLFLTSQRI